MNDYQKDSLNDLPFSPNPHDVDVLIGRIIDGEATVSQRQHFESLAQRDALLWKRLALRHQDMAMLATHVQQTFDRADKLDLPTHSDVGQRPHAAGTWQKHDQSGMLGSVAPAHHVGGLWLAFTGWAAMFVLAAAWGAGLLPDVSQHDRGHNVVEARSMAPTPEQNLDAYMQAPYVLGDMPPTLLNVDELPDGRLAVSYLRRIVEVRYFDSAAEIPLDAEGTLLLSHKHDTSNGQAVMDAPRQQAEPR